MFTLSVNKCVRTRKILCVCSYFLEKSTSEDTKAKIIEKLCGWHSVCFQRELDYLGYANSLHKNIQFTPEPANCDGNLALLDLNINLNVKE